MDYGFVHNSKVYTPDCTTGVKPEDNEARNRELEQAELAHWAQKPEHMLAYYKFPAESDAAPGLYRSGFRPLMGDASVSTWTGKPLGQITRARVYRHNFGARMVSITVQGTNGARYYGRASWDNGQCINLKRSK